MKNLEMMIGQLATVVQTRPQGTIPSTTITNPKVNEQCKAVTLRSGKELKRLGEKVVHSGPNILHAGADKLLGSQTSHAGADEGSERATTETRDGLQDKEDASRRDTKKKKSLSPAMDPKSPFNFPDFIPPPPFPIEKKRKKIIQEKGLDWMMNIIRKVNVDVSLVDLFLHFPKFSMFFKDLIAKKEKIQDDGVVILSAFCSQFVKGKMPAKRRDPGSCVIPCEMGDKKFPKCLLDQGSGISLMALKTARSIGLEARIEPIDIDLQLADHSIVKPKGIIEDVLVKVDKFILPVDFIVIEMEEDKDMPILFGRPFLATGDVVIETKTNTVMFRVDGENVVIEQEKAKGRLLEFG
ncbi:uncharacterized protein LOC125190018 [Salvia hispanica]|uniref:uncharacterized protein LOC125190018 n=1 Tax=Salvia hispanica TaxID=49212 RepID=UPI002008F27C|nr:uncharacterized protein LOC125190018 [Salvia hispanica]